jgi:hypothetical protein
MEYAFEFSVYCQPLLFLNSWRFSMNKTVEIYFDDLTVEAQENLLEKFDTTEKEENWDVFPITIIDREVYTRDK